MTKKRYSIMPDFTGTTWNQAVKRVEVLEKEITKLLTTEGLDPAEALHAFAESMEGAPCTLLECTEAVFEKVKRLPQFHAAHELPASTETIPYYEAFPSVKPARKNKKPPQP